MVTLYDGGAYLLNGTELIPDNAGGCRGTGKQSRN